MEQDEPEELDFMFDEEMEQMDGRRNTFTDWSDEETDGEIDDHDVNKILIVTQTPPYLRKHPGGDRTGHHTSRAKLTSELAKVINDGLFYYEQDLWEDTYEPEYATIKVRPFRLAKVKAVLVMIQYGMLRNLPIRQPDPQNVARKGTCLRNISVPVLQRKTRNLMGKGLWPTSSEYLTL